jgi:hypothetical protein
MEATEFRNNLIDGTEIQALIDFQEARYPTKT